MRATMTMNAGYPLTAYARGYTRKNEYATTLAKIRFAALLLVAPLIGLAAVTLAPLAGLAILARMAFKALPKRAKDIALFFAAPFVGLAYLMAFPFIGVGMLAYAGARAAIAR